MGLGKKLYIGARWRSSCLSTNLPVRWCFSHASWGARLFLYAPMNAGAIVASPTFSLPEYIGGTRNWCVWFSLQEAIIGSNRRSMLGTIGMFFDYPSQVRTRTQVYGTLPVHRGSATRPSRYMHSSVWDSHMKRMVCLLF